MIRNAKLRDKLKLFLIASNIVLAAVAIVVIVYWVISVRPSQIAQAKSVGRYYYYSMHNLPNEIDKIKADYGGNNKQVSNTKLQTTNKLTQEAISGSGSSHATNHIGDAHDAQNIAEQDKGSDEHHLVLPSQATPEQLVNQVQVSEQVMEQAKEVLKSVKKQHESIDDQVSKANRGNKKRAKISVLITNLGLNRKIVEQALTLPKYCALGFLPYTNNLKPLLDKAQSKGHEIYLYLPLQTNHAADSDPGKYTLLTNFAPEENTMRLSAILGSQAKYNGLYSSYKEIFTDSPSAEFIFNDLEEKNLLLILGKGITKTTKNHLKQYSNIIPANIVLDVDPDKQAINTKLVKLVEIAKRDGKAIGYAHGFTVTIEVIKKWITTLDTQNVELVPVSQLLQVKGN